MKVVFYSLLFYICSSLTYCLAQNFNHPGILHSQNDLDFVKAKINANEQPWKDAYDRFLTTKARSYQGINPKPYASLEYQHHAYENVRCGSFNNPNEGCNDMVYDGMAAYSLALRFYFSEDVRYAAKAIEIIDAWATTYKRNEESNSRLVVSWSTPWYANAAEILKYTSGSGWTSTVDARFNEMLNRFKEYIKWETDGPSNNWTMSQIEARLAVGVFQNDRTYFDAAVEKWKRRIKTYIYQTTDGPFPVTVPGQTRDWTIRLWHDRNNRTGTAYVDGLCMETCRDISHTKLGFFSLMNGAEVAWNQEIDLFKVEEKRIADFMELHANWMMGGNVPSDICDGFLDLVSEDGFEGAYNHIKDRLGRNLPNTLRMINRNRPNGAARWVRKWETLMFAGRIFNDTCVEGGPNGFISEFEEGANVVVNGTVDIAYGACGTFTYLYEQTVDVLCNNSSFGGDPKPGVRKKCYTRPVVYPNIESSTGSQAPNLPENLIDNNLADDARWSVQEYPQSVVIDYGSPQSFTNAQLHTYQGRAYQYTISISNNSQSGFKEVVNRSNNSGTEQPFEDTFLPTEGRYVKLTVTGATNYNGSWISINELIMSSNTLSVNPINAAKIWKVFPNPSSNGVFTLTRQANWILYDIRGVQILKGDSGHLNVSGFAKGMYLLKIGNLVETIIYR